MKLPSASRDRHTRARSRHRAVVVPVVVLLTALTTLMTATVTPRTFAQTTAVLAPAIVTFSGPDGSTFRAVLADPIDIAKAEVALAGDGNAGIPAGALAAGDGGVNAPHAWHMVGTTFVEITIELCDGTATMVDANLDYWLTSVGQFCPWSARVIAIEPFGAEPTPTAVATVLPTAITTTPPVPTPTTAPDTEVPPAPAPTSPVTALPATGSGGHHPERSIWPWFALVVASGLGLRLLRLRDRLPSAKG